MRPPLGPDWRELSLRRSNACAPQRSQLFNRASKNRSVSGKPCLRDHLSITTIFPCTVGWSLKTGFTVLQLFCRAQVKKSHSLQNFNGATSDRRLKTNDRIYACPVLDCSFHKKWIKLMPKARKRFLYCAWDALDERDTERQRDRRKWRHLSSAEIGEEVCTFPYQNAELAKSFGAHFPLPKTLHSSN